jgi:N-methylhydantoinase A/oxoprolinase/acetone carboxylase beta subunit
MGVRVGVDVGGTFTKAVAVELESRSVVATSVVPTTHGAEGGVAAGVVRAVADLAAQVGTDAIELVTHSTTEAVNALLEGDVATVGVVGLGRRPDLGAAEKRTRLSDVEVAAGKTLRVLPAFFDVTDGLPADAIRAAIDGFVAAGAGAVCVAEAFAPDDTTNEHIVADLARDAGLPVCTSTELSGLYGLELRAVTAAINASILPIALRTAAFVDHGVREAAIDAPVMVMRSDGGATDLAGFSTAPVRTLYSGPAASVAGALRYTGVTDAIVVEVGGTSTNIAGIRDGRPSLSYVRVASHATALRSVDVRVIGVAGGSMLRSRRGRVYGVGPRSAHIAGLPYACFLDPDEFDGAAFELVAPVAGDPADYGVIVLRDGRRVALTNTCAANALGVTEPLDYCYASPDAARTAFAVAAGSLRLDATTIARRMLTASGEAACELALRIAKDAELRDPSIVGVGGGAGGLARHVAALLGWPLVIPDRAEVISSIGDALSLLRAERERTTEDAAVIAEMMDAVEHEVLRAGAHPTSVEVRVEDVPERSTVRAVATGAVSLASGATPGREPLSVADVDALAASRKASASAVGAYWLLESGSDLVLLDRFGDDVESIDGAVVAEADLERAIADHTRYRGPITLRPTVWTIDERRIVELNSFTPETNAFAGRAGVTYIVGRSR